MKTTILTYLKETHSLTGWPFFGLVHIRNKFGEGSKDALNELFKEEIIRKRESVQGDLVELIKFE